MNWEAHQQRKARPPEEKRGLRFDPTIRASDVLVIIAGISSVFTVYNALDKRVALLEQSNVVVQQTVQEVKGDVKTLLIRSGPLEEGAREHARTR
jgi:hypothetical protein